MSTSRRRGNREGSTPVLRKDGRWQINVRTEGGCPPQWWLIEDAPQVDADLRAQGYRIEATR